MAVYIDSANNKFRGMIMSHMIADTLDELHVMAKKIGMKKEWFQEDASFPHYDVSISRKKDALKLGAIEIERREIVRKMRELRKTDEYKKYKK